MKKLNALAVLFLACVSVATAQINTLTATTTSTAITSATANVITVTSATGISSGRLLFIDQEAMVVKSVSGTNITVIRGIAGTAAVTHVSGAPVLAGLPEWFYDTDPFGSCTAASTLVTPYVNIKNGNQWLCSTVTSQWVPGWNNLSRPLQPTAAVASAAGLITPSGPLFHVTGTAAVTGFNIPVGFSDGQICAIPDGLFTTTNANNFAIATTAVVSKPICWNYDRATAKFYPSY